MILLCGGSDPSRSACEAAECWFRLEAFGVQDACDGVDTMLAILGCEVSNASAVADCVDWAARCRACKLLLEADPRLSMDCDEFDDGPMDLSCDV